MTNPIATLSKESDISIIKLDDGKANAFSYDMLSQVNELLAKVPRDSGALIITHYNRILEHVKPDKIHVLIDGKIVKSGGPELANQLEERGYDWIEKEVMNDE